MLRLSRYLDRHCSFPTFWQLEDNCSATSNGRYFDPVFRGRAALERMASILVRYTMSTIRHQFERASASKDEAADSKRETERHESCEAFVGFSRRCRNADEAIDLTIASRVHKDTADEQEETRNDLESNLDLV